QLELQRGRRLLELAERVARGREVQVLRELLGDRARAAQPIAPAPCGRNGQPEALAALQAQGLRDLLGIDAVVRAEAGVLSDDHHALKNLGRTGEGGWADRRTAGLGHSVRPSARPPVR